jgi:uncharacterized phage infection (PIP) family protein YhgE
MIEESIIQSAKQIRIEFITLNEKLESYENDIKKLGENFIKVSDDLKGLDGKNESVTSLRDKVLEMLTKLEDESKSVSDKVENINKDMEKLKKRESDLYKVIKNRYPNMSDEEIKIDIQKRI